MKAAFFEQWMHIQVMIIDDCCSTKSNGFGELSHLDQPAILLILITVCFLFLTNHHEPLMNQPAMLMDQQLIMIRSRGRPTNCWVSSDPQGPASGDQ